jgi:hypothetical protein
MPAGRRRLFLQLMELTVALNEQAPAPVLVQPTPRSFANVTARLTTRRSGRSSFGSKQTCPLR